MKPLFYLIGLIFLLNFQLFSQENNEIKDVNKKKVEIQTTAECEMCKERIEKAINKLDGIETSNLDIPTKIVTVVYNSKVIDLESIKKTISKVGYDADDIKADKKAYKKLPECCKIGGHDHK